ncbi:BON domain-containing protein, partial [Streptomyces zhihengii]
VVDRFLPVSRPGIGVTVDKGRVTLTGPVADPALIPVVERLARAVEGVVDVRCDLIAPTTATGRGDR